MNNKRLHLFDGLRSSLLLLGVYYHLASMYTQPTDLNKYDVLNQHWIFNIYMSFQSYFRMPTFFLIGGFFGAFLAQKRGFKEMIINRFNRVFLPLVVFIWPIWIFYKFIQNATNTFLSGVGILDTIQDSLEIFTSIEYLIPSYTLHLWFLNYLFFFSLLAYGFNKVNLKIPYKKNISILFKRQWLGTIILCFFYGLFMVILNNNKAGSQHDFKWLWFLHLDGIKSFLAYGFFYVLGWIIYYKKHMIIYMSFTKQLIIFSFINLIILVPTFYLHTFFQYNPIDDFNIIFGENSSSNFIEYNHKKFFIDSIFTFLFNFGVPSYVMLLLALFSKFFNKHSKFQRYISDASYWVYIIHVIFTLTVPAIFYALNISVILKFTFSAIFTTILCFITYHLLVRKTYIGYFLNGKKYL